MPDTAPIISLNYNYGLSIDTAPGTSTPVPAVLSKGFANVTQSMNEVLYQASYIGEGGWGSTEVTGGQLTLTLTGVRYYGDAAQDYIFSDAVQMNFGDARKTTLTLTRGDQSVVEWPVTIANVTEAGGDANQPNAITVVFHSNGQPQLTDTTTP